MVSVIFQTAAVTLACSQPFLAPIIPESELAKAPEFFVVCFPRYDAATGNFL